MACYYNQDGQIIDEQGKVVRGRDGSPLDPERLERTIANLTRETRDNAHVLALAEDDQRTAESLRGELARVEAETQRRDEQDQTRERREAIAADAERYGAKDPASVALVVDGTDLLGTWQIDTESAMSAARRDYPYLFGPAPGDGRPAKEADQDRGWMSRLLRR